MFPKTAGPHSHTSPSLEEWRSLAENVLVESENRKPSTTTAGASTLLESLPMQNRRFEIPSLDGIRAISFLIVFVSHTGLGHIVPGGLGVTIFFFLSGYLITSLLRREWERFGRIDLAGFFLRRTLRIFPPLYAALFAAWIAWKFGMAPGKPTWDGMAALAFYYLNYRVIFAHDSGALPGTDIYWSLSVEEHFYAFFPLLFPLLCRTARNEESRATWIGGACAAILIWRALLVFLLDAPTVRTYIATDTRIDSILFGCLLALWNNPAFNVEQKPTKPEAVRTAILACAGTGLLIATLLFRAPWFRETLRYTLQGIALVPLFAAAVRFPDWHVVRILAWKPLRFLGVLSYSLYLVHFTATIVVARLVKGPMPLVMAASGVASLALALAIHHLVEKPALKLKDQITARRAGAGERSPKSGKAAV
jgi:peptidoglycan/LPS O-acetylase OafA/YrhL